MKAKKQTKAPVPKLGARYKDKDPRNSMRVVHVVKVDRATMRATCDSLMHPYRTTRISFQTLATRFVRLT